MTPERVLLIDDEPTVCEVLGLLLGQHGYETVSVGSCDNARAAALHGPYIAALVDKNLPDGSGVELLADLRRALPDTALLIMTGYSSFDTAVAAMRHGASDYLVKPFSSMDEVVLRLRRAVDALRVERERLRLVASLDEARRELATVFEAVGDPVLILDVDGGVRKANAAAIALYGPIPPGAKLDLLGDEGAAQSIARAAAGEVVRRERVVRRNASGGTTTLMCTLAPIGGVDGQGQGVVETAVSIDEALRAQRALHQADKLATLGVLAATLAHELANPLGCALSNANILGEIDATGRVTGTDPTDAGEILREIRASLSLCREILRRTREFAAPQQSSPMAPVPFAQVANDAVRFVAPQFQRKVQITSEVADDLRVLGDRVGLVQVLVNMLVNAGHALRGRPDPRIDVRGFTDGAEVVLTISDNGCGIPETELPRIWERFFTTKPADQGTGLGLAVCRDVVRSHGGNINVDSRVGVGTTFEIRLPVCHPELRARILIVDDDPLVLAAIARALKSHFEVATALSADEAISVLSRDEQRVDMVLTDYLMPGTNGADLLAQVSQRWPGTKRMMMTGNLDPSARALIDERARPLDILLKPLEGVLLRSRLLSVLEN